MPVKNVIGLICILWLVSGCSISYTFNNATIDYTKIKSITIQDFPNQAPLVYPPLAQMLSEQMKDVYSRKTRLQFTQANGDLSVEGEITGYDLAPMAIKEDAYASQTRLTITVRVRYANRVTPEDDFEQSFSAYREFNANVMLTQVQDELCTEIVKELIDQIYNATVANW